MDNQKIYDVIIIGSGPSGLTAGIYASRASLRTLILEGEQPGGQLTTTTEVENFPGFPTGITGGQLMNDMRKQATKFGGETKFEIVRDVDFSNKPFSVTTDSETYQAKTVIISTGASARYMGLENEARLKGKGVSACATCDGFFFKDKEIVVAGGGDSAMEEANFLTKFASKVTLIHRRNEFRASPIMLERVKNNPKIDVITNREVLDVLGEERVIGIKTRDVKTGEETVVNAQGFFLAIGHVPNTKIFKGIIELDDNDFIVTKNNSKSTSVEGVFACGDVQDKKYKQAITAAGSGCMAALDAQKYLEENNG